MIAIACGICKRPSASNLEFRKAKQLEEFPTRRRCDWRKIGILMATSRHAYRLYVNERRICEALLSYRPLSQSPQQDEVILVQDAWGGGNLLLKSGCECKACVMLSFHGVCSRHFYNTIRLKWDLLVSLFGRRAGSKLG